MKLKQLQARHVRNLASLKAEWHPQWNILIGPNGAGKTSVLEAIHLLSVGRSFRSRQNKSIIAYDAPTLSCYGEVQAPDGALITKGIERHRTGEGVCKVQSAVCDRLSDFVAVLPVQVITPETFKLLTAGPSERRRLMDWGVFHVEPQIGQAYQRYQRLLKQRNAALKFSRQLTAFDAEWVEYADAIHRARQQYVAQLQPFVDNMLTTLLDCPCTMSYEPGWLQDRPLAEALAAGFSQDQRLGYTRLGPHVADLQFLSKGFPVQQIFSRGQLKMLIFAIYLAQAQHLSASQGKQCVYLLDDLVSELDKENRARLLGAIAQQGHQAFLTGSDQASWDQVLADFEYQMFHVEHGTVCKA